MSSMAPTIPRCINPPAAPENGERTLPPEPVAGASIIFSCNATNSILNGEVKSTCLSNGSWSAGTPSCDPLPLLGQQRVNPGSSCKEIYLDRIRRNATAASGTYWLLGRAVSGLIEPMQLWCDMVTPGEDGLRGWTLCAKYDRDREEGNTRYLQHGFGRAPFSSSDMIDLSTFTGPRKWSSVDCRPFIAAGAKSFMHAGSDEPGLSNPFPGVNNVRFTNIVS